MEDAPPMPKQRPEQEAGNTTGKGIQKEEEQGRKNQITGIHFNFFSGLSAEMTRITVNNPGQWEVPPDPLLLNPYGKGGTKNNGHQLDNGEVSDVSMDSRVSNLEASLNNQGRHLQVIEYILKQLVVSGM